MMVLRILGEAALLPLRLIWLGLRVLVWVAGIVLAIVRVLSIIAFLVVAGAIGWVIRRGGI